MSKSRQEKMDKRRTNLSLTGEDVELLNNVKSLISIKIKANEKLSSVAVVRVALKNYLQSNSSN